jgi:hypothetical protein
LKTKKKHAGKCKQLFKAPGEPGGTYHFSSN